jgi:hypothetical protein
MEAKASLLGIEIWNRLEVRNYVANFREDFSDSARAACKGAENGF